MAQKWSFSLPLLLVLFVHSGFALVGQCQGPNFHELDSTFRKDVGINSQEEMQHLLLQLRSLAKTPEEQGKVEMCNSLFHYKGSRLGMALLANEKALKIFDSIGDPELVLQNHLISIDIYQKLRDPQKVEETLSLIFQIPRASNLDNIASQILRKQAYWHLNRGNSDSAHLYLNNSIEIAKAIKDTSELAKAKYLKAIAYQLQGKPKKALKIMQDLGNEILAVPDYTFQASYHNVMGMVYMSVDQNEDAVSSYKKGLKIASDQEMRYEHGMLLSSLAIGLKAIGDTIGAIKNYEEALEIAMELSQWSTISSICSGLADIHIGLKNWDLAEDFAQKGLDYSRRAQLKRMETYALMRVAMVKIQTGYFQEALDALTLADSLTRPSGNWTRVRDINELRAEASEKLGAMEQALAFQRMAADAQDSIEFVDAKKYADSLKLSQPVIVVKEENPGGENNIWIWVAMILGIAVVIGIGFRSFRTRSQKQKITHPRQVSTEEEASQAISKAIQALRENKDWTNFMLQFDKVYPDLMPQMAQRHPNITPTDLRILALARLGLSTDETAELLGISPSSVKKARYRTRKRLGIPVEQTLLQYMLQG